GASVAAETPGPRPSRGDPLQADVLRGGDGGLRLANAVVRGERGEQPALVEPVEALVAEPLQERADPRVAGRHDAAVAAGDLLGVLQGEAGDVPDRADGLAAIPRPPGLRAVLDQDQAVLVGEGSEGVQVARVAGQVDGDDRP